MYDYSQINYYPYNMYQNGGYGYQYPVFGTCLNNNLTLNTPQFDVNMCQDYGYQYPMHIDTRQSNQSVSTPQQNLNVQNLSNTVNFKASEQIQAKSQKEGLSTGAKWAIGIGVTTALAIGADFLFCKGKHVKNLWGKLKGNNSKPNDTTPGSSKPGGTNPGSTKPGSTKPDAVKPETVKPETVKSESVKPDAVKPESVKPEFTQNAQNFIRHLEDDLNSVRNHLRDKRQSLEWLEEELASAPLNQRANIIEKIEELKLDISFDEELIKNKQKNLERVTQRIINNGGRMY